jgi:hypothetical protein
MASGRAIQFNTATRRTCLAQDQTFANRMSCNENYVMKLELKPIAAAGDGARRRDLFAGWHSLFRGHWGALRGRLLIGLFLRFMMSDGASRCRPGDAMMTGDVSDHSADCGALHTSLRVCETRCGCQRDKYGECNNLGFHR